MIVGRVLDLRRASSSFQDRRNDGQENRLRRPVHQRYRADPEESRRKRSAFSFDAAFEVWSVAKCSSIARVGVCPVFRRRDRPPGVDVVGQA